MIVVPDTPSNAGKISIESQGNFFPAPPLLREGHRRGRFCHTFPAAYHVCILGILQSDKNFTAILIAISSAWLKPWEIEKLAEDPG
jgi:hypothetical protein